MGATTRVRKEIMFIHDDKEYIVVIDFRSDMLAKAAIAARRGNGVLISSSRLFDMTTVRETFKSK
jgi:hypothetical protein